MVSKPTPMQAEIQWRDGVKHNGLLYGIPHDSDYILIYNIATGQVSGSGKIPSSISSGLTGGGSNQGGHHWKGGVEHNGIIYAIPHSSNHILIYNTATGQISGSEQVPSSIDGGANQWAGGAVDNGILYGT